jgi:hypothetical protein
MSNGLDVALMKDPFGDWSPPDDRHTEIEFSDPEWGSFFFKALGVIQTEYIQGEECLDYDTRRKLDFRKSLHDYPLLSRIDSFYQDAGFSPDEVEVLRDELRRVEDLAFDKDGRAFLDGMVKACDLALSAKMGIFLGSS